MIFVWYSYLTVAESASRGTLGERIFKARVVMADGRRCTFSAALRRNVTKTLLTPYAALILAALLAGPHKAASTFALDVATVLVLLGLAATPLLVRCSAGRQSLGDRMAGTVVVRGGKVGSGRPVTKSATPCAEGESAQTGRNQATARLAPAELRPSARGMPSDGEAEVGSHATARPMSSRLEPAPWGWHEVGLTATIGLGPPLALSLILKGGATSSPNVDVAVATLIATMIVNGWCVAWAWGFSLRRYHLGLAAWGLRRPGPAILWLVPFSLLVMQAVDFVQAQLAPVPSRGGAHLYPHTLLGAILFGASSCLVFPALEEVFYRAFVFRGLLRSCGPLWAAVISAALFAAMHREPPLIAPFFISGLLLAWAYYRTNSLWTSMSLHVALNGMAFLGWMLK
jgi:membrane protease YdiL (CAAX protease family)